MRTMTSASFGSETILSRPHLVSSSEHSRTSEVGPDWMYTVFACISSAGIGALRANAPVHKVTARNDKRRIDKIRRMATLLKVHSPSRLKEHSEAVDRRMVLAVGTRNNGLGTNGAASGPPQRPFDCDWRWPTRVRLFHFAYGWFFCGGRKGYMPD